jgi:hypothetical protein
MRTSIHTSVPTSAHTPIHTSMHTPVHTSMHTSYRLTLDGVDAPDIDEPVLLLGADTTWLQPALAQLV